MMFRGSIRVAGAASAAGLCLLAATARADVKIVTRVTVTGNGAAAMGMGARGGRPGAGAAPKTETETVTTYYKGQKSRVESGATVILFDGTTGKTLTLNPATKTYQVQSDVRTQRLDEAAQNIDFKTSGSARPTGATRAILGKTAKEYAYSITMAMTLKPGITGPDGKPTAAPRPGTVRKPFVTMVIKGNQWTVENLTSGGGNGGIIAAQLSALQSFPGFKGIFDALSQIKGVAIEGKQTMSMQSPMAAMMGGTPPTTTITTVPVSLKEAPLPDSLFAIPAGYKQVQPAAPTISPRPGMRPGKIGM